MHRSVSALARFSLAAVIAAVFGSGLSIPAAAQDVSFSDGLSGSLSDPLATSTSTSGFNSSFDASTANVTNPDVRLDVSDATHSQLLGSTLSPLDTAYANPYVDTAPRTGIQSDAQAAVGFNDFTFGGQKSQLFSTGGSQRFEGAGIRQSTLGSSGLLSMRAAFAGGIDAQSAFSGRPHPGSSAELGFSAEGVALPTVQTGPGGTQTLASTGALDDRVGFFATDPILTGSHSGWETGPELHGDLPSPSSQTLSYFGEAPGPGAGYAFDDGQTPLTRGPGTPGQILGSPPEYLPPTTGFPDSTKGLAALPMETGGLLSPLSPAPNLKSSPFAPVSEGTVFEAKTRLQPSLHATYSEPRRGSFDAYERRLQELRITHGLSISQAAAAKQQDLRAFQHSQGRRRPNDTFEQLNTGAGSYQPELMGSPVIR